MLMVIVAGGRPGTMLSGILLHGRLLDDRVQLAPIEPYAPAFESGIDLDPLPFGQ